MAPSSLALIWRAVVHAFFHSGRRTSVWQEVRKAGQASRTSSRSQPGMAANVLRCSVCAWASGVVGVGGVAGGSERVVVQAARHKATMTANAGKLVRVLF